MPPPAILDLANVDTSRLLYTREQIYDLLPQRFEFSQLDGIYHLDKAAGTVAGYREVRPDEWWCRGHMPGNPIFPGILMMESAAHLAAFAQLFIMPMEEGSFMGFGGVDGAKFRGSVIPPARIDFAGKMIEARTRRFVCDIQAYCKGTMVFEGRVTGMPLRQ
ncbi:MAG TPA: 3-hydroxyacyl-ACP dehydratase FabZ family protein [Phycisphaerae bacterium]|nr:3-hydroxyacyl-ACP dehydratase FabZ family protein [Phycisphaerae bacterium]